MLLRCAIAFCLPLLTGAALAWLSPTPAPKFVDAICASREVPAGIPLDDPRLRRCALPRAYLPSDVVTTLEPTRTLDRALLANEPVRQAYLGPPRATVDPKLRSVPLKLHRRDAAAPFLEVGDFVDVISVSTDPATQAPFAMHLVQLARVGDIVPDGADEVMVSLSVAAEEAQVLAAARTGRLVLTVRNPEDAEILEEKGRTTVKSLLDPQHLRVLFQKHFPSCILIRGPGSAPAPTPEPERAAVPSRTW